ncbi:hypothetical protein ACI2K4_06180 [Micromonospora sp. NPDC050397]|uniref:hypothetical protein n=1 Tax=Micromonospora sp. NPDC050397 TaxID=3364279 RepID=UPI0038509291
MKRRQIRTVPLLLAVATTVVLAVTAMTGGAVGGGPGSRQPAVPLAGDPIGVCATCFTDPKLEQPITPPGPPVTPPR